MGGTWIVQNKVRAGAYINFTAVPTPVMSVGSRGVGTMAIPLSWGPQDTMIEVLSSDMLDGSSLTKVGFVASDPSAKLLSLMLSGCHKALIYRANTGGAQAKGTLGELTATAKYAGVLGNDITISIYADALPTGFFYVDTYVAGIRKDRQTAKNAQELKSNDFVTFTGTGALVANAGTRLADGTDGAITGASLYPAYIKAARNAIWQTMALTQDNATYAKSFVEFAEEMRNEQGKYVQVVVSNYALADSPGVINADCGATVNGIAVTAEEATAWVAGITAGAAINRSNTGRVFSGATAIAKSRTNGEIISALDQGMFILSMNQNGQVVAEKDINSLHTFTSTIPYAFSKNRVIRVLDEIGTTVTNTWEQSFLGKVSNNDQGRMMFKADMISYLRQLENLSAITNVKGADDIVVTRGTDIDSVLCDLYVQPVDSMEKLYMTVTVNT